MNVHVILYSGKSLSINLAKLSQNIIVQFESLKKGTCDAHDKAKRNPRPQIHFSEVRMSVIHSGSSDTPAPLSLVDLTALIYVYVFESKDVQPVISVAVVSLLWDVSEVAPAALSYSGQALQRALL